MSENEKQVKLRQLERQIAEKKHKITSWSGQLEKLERAAADRQNRNIFIRVFDVTGGLGDMVQGPALIIAIATAQEELDQLELEHARLSSESVTPQIKPKTQDEVKIENVIDRARREDELKTQIQAGKRVRQKEALIRWYKEERKRIITDDSLSRDEQNILLTETDNSYDEQMKELDRGNYISIYEDQ